MITALINGLVFTGSAFEENKVLLIENDKIKDLVTRENVPGQARMVDCSNCYISPGMIDLQVYGGGGVLFSNEPSAASLKQMGDSLLKTGTTSFLITLATNSLDVFRKAIRVVKENSHPAVLGLHFEGPYLNPVKSGAHLKEYIKKPELSEVSAWLGESEGVVKMITLAPEICRPEIIQLLRQNNVIVSAGHSNATFEEATEGFKAGISATTHLFNAMSSFHHRDTGLPGAVFKSDTVSSSIIADGIHVSYEALELSKKLMGERLFLITDAVEESRGVYVHVRNKDRFTLPDGTLSGSMLSMLQAVQNCVQHAGIPLAEALRMATTYPARVANLKHQGKIAPGYDADLLIFDDRFAVRSVFSKGKLVEGANA